MVIYINSFRTFKYVKNLVTSTHPMNEQFTSMARQLLKYVILLLSSTNEKYRN